MALSYLSMRSHSKSALLVIAIAVAGTFAWWLRPTSFISDDSYFYLVVARNLALHGHQNFSGVTDTNGFQPLWGYTLGLYSLAIGHIRAGFLWNVRYALPLSIGLLATATWVCLRLSGQLRLSPAPIAGLPIAYVCCFGVLYSEATVELILIGVLALRLSSSADKSHRWWAITGLVVGLAVLARIDLAFFAAAATAVLFLQNRPGRLDSVICLSSVLSLVGAYLISNQVFFGYPMPMSGFLKSTFPNLNLRPIEVSGLSTTVSGVNLIFGLSTLIFTGIALVLLRRHRVWPLLIAMFVGAAGQAVEVGLFGRGPTSWYWYYVLPVAMTGIAAAALIERAKALDRAIVYLVAFIAIVALILGLETRSVNHNQAAGLRIAKSLGLKENQTIIVSDWPGDMAFESHFNVFSTDLLTTNYRFYEEMKGSPDAFQFVTDQARYSNAPVKAILVYSNTADSSLKSVVADRSQTALIYFDPAKEPAKVIGRLYVGRPAYTDSGTSVWRVPSN